MSELKMQTKTQNNQNNQNPTKNQSDKSSEKTNVRGKLTFEDKVIQKIVGMALEEVDGLLSVDGGFFSNLADKIVNTDNVTSGVDVEVGKQQVAVDLNIIAEYKKDIPKIFEQIKQVVHQQVEDMTDLDVVEINVNVIDIKTKSQQESDDVSLQDRVTGAAQATGKFAGDQVEKVKDKVGNSDSDEDNQARVK